MQKIPEGGIEMTRRILLSAGMFAFLFFSLAAFLPAAYPLTEQGGQGQAEEPKADFQKAHESFMKKEYDASAASIRKGADYLRKEAESAGDKGKKLLTASVAELEKLADSVEKGAVKSDKKLKDAFSRAEHAVANDQYVKATDSWVRKETKKTGQALDSAAMHMERAADWSGQKLKAGASRAVKEGREVSDKLVKGAGYVPEKVGKALNRMGDAISGFGRKIVPGKDSGKE
jgi:hypothetical protein